MERAVAVFAIVNFTVIGLSHIFQQQAWKDFFQRLHAQGRAGALANGFLSLAMGSIIVAFHNVWSGLPIILTLIGWAYVLKSVLVFLNPEWGLRSMAKVQTSPPGKFLAAGLGLIAIAITLLICVMLDFYDPANSQ